MRARTNSSQVPAWLTPLEQSGLPPVRFDSTLETAGEIVESHAAAEVECATQDAA